MIFGGVIGFTDGQSIATVSHDRTIKLWTSKNAEKDKSMDVD